MRNFTMELVVLIYIMSGEVEPGDRILAAGGVYKDFLEFALQKN